MILLDRLGLEGWRGKQIHLNAMALIAAIKRLKGGDKKHLRVRIGLQLNIST
jgi:hypothetical protein